MDKGHTSLVAVACAVAWVGVIIAAATVLDGTSELARVLLILGGGVAPTIIVLGGLASLEKKGQ